MVHRSDRALHRSERVNSKRWRTTAPMSSPKEPLQRESQRRLGLKGPRAGGERRLRRELEKSLRVSAHLVAISEHLERARGSPVRIGQIVAKANRPLIVFRGFSGLVLRAMLRAERSREFEFERRPIPIGIYSDVSCNEQVAGGERPEALAYADRRHLGGVRLRQGHPG